jgi:hypothetical protein
VGDLTAGLLVARTSMHARRTERGSADRTGGELSWPWYVAVVIFLPTLVYGRWDFSVLVL